MYYLNLFKYLKLNLHNTSSHLPSTSNNLQEGFSTLIGKIFLSTAAILVNVMNQAH